MITFNEWTLNDVCCYFVWILSINLPVGTSDWQWMTAHWTFSECYLDVACNRLLQLLCVCWCSGGGLLNFDGDCLEESLVETAVGQPRCMLQQCCCLFTFCVGDSQLFGGRCWMELIERLEWLRDWWCGFSNLVKTVKQVLEFKQSLVILTCGDWCHDCSVENEMSHPLYSFNLVNEGPTQDHSWCYKLQVNVNQIKDQYWNEHCLKIYCQAVANLPASFPLAVPGQLLIWMAGRAQWDWPALPLCCVTVLSLSWQLVIALSLSCHCLVGIYF